MMTIKKIAAGACHKGARAHLGLYVALGLCIAPAAHASDLTEACQAAWQHDR